MRIVVVGAGAVGGVVAANLALAGMPVVAVARGEHARVMRESGLRYESPTGTRIVDLPVATSVGEIDVTDDDVFMLGVKSQDTVGVLNDLRAAGVTDQPIVCMQNGVANERQALRLFPNVYGMVVMLPADHLAPGVVRVWTAPSSGLLDVGRYPHGVDDLSVQLAATLEAATFGSIPRADIMSWKYRKLLMNLGNAVEAVCGRDARLGEMVRAEGEAVLAAAGITVVSTEEDLARRGDALKIQPVGDEPHRAGGSSWQSLQRGTGTIETDYLTGEIVLLGRLHGVPTPANQALQQAAAEMARTGEAPASRTVDDVFRSIDPA
ncbi:MAG: 2-dehydropantoate 2-reductase N-terminal domain-containing protein [Ilumatobacteraceae bacterium]